MPSRKRFSPHETSGKRLLVYVAVGLFVIVDVFLVIWAIDSVRASGQADAPSPSSRAVVPQPSAEVEEAASATAVPTEAVAPTRLIAALDDDLAWRVTTGPCPTAAAPELSTDGGATWSPADAAPLGISAVQHIDVLSPAIATFLGFDSGDCTPDGVRTFVAGADFAPFSPLVESGWLLDPSLPTTIATPAGGQAAPCALPVAIAPRSVTAAAVLCADQAVFVTDDSGGTWTGGRTIPGIIGIAETESGYIALTAGAQDCIGVQVTPLNDTLVPGIAGCLPLDLPTTTLPGAVAGTQAADTIWIWAGDTVWRSQDGGATWQ